MSSFMFALSVKNIGVIFIPNVSYFIVGWKNTTHDSVQSVHNTILRKPKWREWDHKYQIEQTPPYNNGFESNSKVEAKAAACLK